MVQDSSSEAKRSKRSFKKQCRLAAEQEINRLDSLPWSSSLPEDNGDDSIPLFIGSNELEGGFLTLEEIDESEYGLDIGNNDLGNERQKLKRKVISEEETISNGSDDKRPVVEVTENKDAKKKVKRKKEKKKGLGGKDGDERPVVDTQTANGTKVEVTEKKDAKKKVKRKKEKKKGPGGKDDDEKPVVGTQTGNDNKVKVSKEKDVKKKKEKKSKPDKKIDLEKKGKANIIQGNANSDGINVEDNDDDTVISEENPVDEEEYCAWNELRLHPTIMKSIYRLKFKEPTPIQKSCIPAAAHQGKDIIGAAETGSGKTLAFGLPILQRLLDEREKVERLMANKGEVGENISPRSVLRALIVTPTIELALQVTDHIKEAARGTDIRVVPIVGGMSSEKQERLLKARPEIVVGTPGRLWDLMSGGETHLVELHFLSFFVLDEADRMIEAGHFPELQSIIDMLPKESSKSQLKNTENCVTSVTRQLKKRQTLVFSATLALSAEFRRKSKRRTVIAEKDGFSSIETLSERAGMRENKEIVDLTNSSILPERLVQSIIECQEEEKDAYLCYILSIHGQGRTIVFCSSIAALRHISSFLRILNINIWTLHSEMQKRSRLKSVDRFRTSEDGILVATDAAARGLDIVGVRTVVHYQLPHTRDVYVHRCGRTARASTDGCSIAIISPNDASTYADIYRSFAKDGIQRFPIERSYMPEIMKRSSLAHQIDKIARKDSKEKAEKTWWERNAKSVELDLEDDDSDEETVKKHRQRKVKSSNLDKLQQELSALLSRPLQPKTLSKRFLAGAGVSPLLQRQFGELTRQKLGNDGEVEHNKRRKLVVIGQDLMEPLEALKKAGDSAILDLEKIAKNHKNADNLRRKRKEMKKRMHEQRRKQRKMLKQGGS